MEYHTNELGKACRVCGKRANTANGRNRSHLVAQHIKELIEVFSIDASTDSEDIYPLSFCHSCFSFMHSWRTRDGDAPAVGRVYTWVQHTEPNCEVCQHFRNIQAGGGKAGGRQGQLGRPKTNTEKELASRLTSMAPASFFPAIRPLPRAHTSLTIWCVVCMDILDQPIELSCGNIICLLCCTKWLTMAMRVDCPCCYTSLLDHANPPSRVTMDVLGSQLVECSKGCNRVVKVEQYMSHMRSKCQAFFEHSIHSPSRSTIRDLLEKGGDTPTNPTERRVANSLIKRLMAENKEEELLQLPTGGQPISLLPVRACRVRSSEACSKTLSHRTKTLTNLRSSISGGDTSAQLRSEIKALSKEEREAVLQEAQLPIHIPPNHALAMKADLALPWAKMRVISRWLKSLKISLGSEAKQRVLAKELVGDNLVAELGAFTFRRDGGGEDIPEVPFAYVPNLIRRATDLIQAHRGTTGLTQHGVIPEKEIWLKLGGDKGHGSFKLNLQLCNVEHPNSQKNTCLLSMCMAGDSTTNLHTCLDMYAEHVRELQGMGLRGDTIKVFLTGDYEFLCRMYGLSGASGKENNLKKHHQPDFTLFLGRHCCLWCEVTYAQLQKPLAERGRSKPRSLATLVTDYKAFQEKGKGDITKAKIFNNVIRPTIFDIPLDMICLPGLHMSLGIFDRLWELLEAASTELDLVLAENTSAGGEGNTFEEYVVALRKREQLTTKLYSAEQHVTHLDQLVTYLSLHLPNAAHNPQLEILRGESSKALLQVAAVIREIETTEAFLQKKFKPRDGPYFKSLSNSLDRLHVQRQAYHGGSFVGNHVHKLLKPASIDTLLSGLTGASTNSNMVAPTKAVCDKFRKVFLLFSKCHNQCS